MRGSSHSDLKSRKSTLLATKIGKAEKLSLALGEKIGSWKKELAGIQATGGELSIVAREAVEGAGRTYLPWMEHRQRETAFRIICSVVRGK